MKIYTKTGDAGQTGLFGGKRVFKDDCRVEAYGGVDELNAVLGMVVSICQWDEMIQILVTIQSTLFDLGADLATPFNNKHEDKIQRLTTTPITELENWIDYLDSQLAELRQFILPGGSQLAAILHYARTVCRRAERRVTTLAQLDQINTNVLVYLNRLSDLLFVMARSANHLEGTEDLPWQPRDDE